MDGFQGYSYLVTVPIWNIQINVVVIQMKLINKSQIEPVPFSYMVSRGEEWATGHLSIEQG